MGAIWARRCASDKSVGNRSSVARLDVASHLTLSDRSLARFAAGCLICATGLFVGLLPGISLGPMIPLSILDLSVVTTGTRPAAALQNSIDLARHADALGYVRYWLAEHHNLSSVASPAPDI